MSTQNETAAEARVPAVPVDDLADLLEVIRIAKLERRKWQDIIDNTTDKIKERLGESEVGTVAGHQAVFYTHYTVTRVDIPRLREEMGDLLDPYLVTRTERRFQIKET